MKRAKRTRQSRENRTDLEEIPSVPCYLCHNSTRNYKPVRLSGKIHFICILCHGLQIRKRERSTA